MVSWRRWGAVAAGVVALLALPPAIGALPAGDRPVSAAALLAAVQASGGAGYAGYAEAAGGLRLPLTAQFTALTGLFGGHTRLRVWWRGERDWRVDAVEATGETDVHRTASGTWTWEYERNRATLGDEPPVRQPRAADLDPAQLGRRLLSEAEPDEVGRLPVRRVAGVNAPGLRLRPDDPRTTITRVDVWPDPGTGLPLRVEVYGAGQGVPALQAAFLDFRPGTPDPGTTAFEPPPDARLFVDQTGDLAARIDQFAPARPPGELAGYSLRRRVEGLGAVGTYGRGVTVLAAVPLLDRISRPLREALKDTPGIKDLDSGLLFTVGPLSLLLSNVEMNGRAWLVTGTVTAETLQRAANELTASVLGPR
jgi:hypothetical protein